MNEDLFKRSKPSMPESTGLYLDEREKAATEKAANFTATMAMKSKPESADEKAKRLEEEIAFKAHLDIKTKEATDAFKEQHMDVTLQQLQQTVTFHDLNLRAAVRRIFEQGYRAGFAAGKRYAQTPL